MKVIRCTAGNLEAKLRALAAQSSLFDAQIESRTREILDAVRQGGDAALLELTRRFDGATE